MGWIENGVLKTEELYRFFNSPERIDGHLKWNTAQLFQEILNGLKKAGEIGKIPFSVFVDMWGVDYVLLDKNDEVIDGAYCYRDLRTDEIIKKVHNELSFAELCKKTGIAFNQFNTVYQLFCDKKSGRMEKAASFLMLPDYFHFLLTSVKKQEYTNATTTGMVNAETHIWDEDILETLGFKKELFSELSQPSSYVGEFTDEIASCVGYKAKVILPATHDTAIKENRLTELLNLYEVKAGECYFIPSGTIHTIGKGCLICEIQQNSNLTYRVYDYERKDNNGNERELHTDKALMVTNLHRFEPISFEDCLGKCEYFTVQKCEIDSELLLFTDEKSFHCLTCVKGNGFIEDMEISKGQFLCACKLWAIL